MSRTARAWNPWQELSRMQREMNGVFGLPHVAFGEVRPEPDVNMYQGEKGLLVTALLPGLNTEELEITAVSDTLKLKGTYIRDPSAEGASCQRREREVRPFERTLVLPFEVDPGTAEAVYENGVLTVTVSRPAHQQPKKILLKPSA